MRVDPIHLVGMSHVTVEASADGSRKMLATSPADEDEADEDDDDTSF